MKKLGNVDLNKVHHLNCLDEQALKSLPDNSVDAVVTDPPYGLSKEPDIRKVLTAWLNEEDYEHGSKGFMGKCFHPDTDVLTKDGWKNVREIKSSDIICSLNPLNNQIEYVKCNKTFEYDFDGELIEIGGRSVKQLVTPNHNIYVKFPYQNEYKLMEASELDKNVFYLKNQGEWKGKITTEIAIDGKTFNVKWFMKFLGLFLGDGFSVNRKAQPQKQDFIVICGKKERELNAINECLKNLGVKHTITQLKNGMTWFYIYDKSLLSYVKKLGKSHDKYIPSDLFEYDSSLLEFLYQGMMETDGCTQGIKSQHVYFTVSEQLANDFQRLCLHTGRSCVKTKRKNNEKSFNKDGFGYLLSVIQKGKEFYLEKTNHKNQDLKNYKTVPYQGKVYCVELVKHHILLSRFHGKTVWSGNSWDSFVPSPLIWKEVFRVLKHGGYIACFASTRTVDLMGMSLRLAGFEIKDQLAYMFGTGFPKSMSISKAIDKKFGAEREVIGKRVHPTLKNPPKQKSKAYHVESLDSDKEMESWDITAPATEFAKKYDGYGTALKPSYEPIIIARKPLSEKTIVDNVLKWGTGGINIDACRIPHNEPVKTTARTGRQDAQVLNTDSCGFDNTKNVMASADPKGRFPANVILDEEARQMLDEQSGTSKSTGGISESTGKMANPSIYGTYHGTDKGAGAGGYGDIGGASRFFYCAKASRKERGEYNTHPTVKPLSLIRYLCSLLNSPNGIILDPFAGSGTTPLACEELGFDWVAFELEADHVEICERRLEDAREKRG